MLARYEGKFTRECGPLGSAVLRGGAVSGECRAGNQEHGGGNVGGKQAAGCAAGGVGEALQRHAENLGRWTKLYAGDEGSGVAGSACGGAEAVWRCGERGKELDCEVK